MDYAVHGTVRAMIVDWVPFSRGIFLTQGSNPGLPHCRRILYPLSHQGSPQLKQVRLCCLPPTRSFEVAQGRIWTSWVWEGSFRQLNGPLRGRGCRLGSGGPKRDLS